MKILVSTSLIEFYQFRFPKSKKKRIRKKWSKRKENYREKLKAVKLGDILYVSPSFLEVLKKDAIQCDENDLLLHHF